MTIVNHWSHFVHERETRGGWRLHLHFCHPYALRVTIVHHWSHFVHDGSHSKIVSIVRSVKHGEGGVFSSLGAKSDHRTHYSHANTLASDTFMSCLTQSIMPDSTKQAKISTKPQGLR